MQDIKTLINHADMALSNKQYEQALNWYGKALSLAPANVYCLSRCGAISAGLQRYDDAVEYMRRAYEADPAKGDNVFNYGNACLFIQDFTRAFSLFVEAEQKGCSEKVLPNLYLQMAFICSMRHDTESANIYLDKCAAADKTGLMMLNPDIISERLNIYSATGDYERAAKTASELVATAPTVFAYYMMQYGIVTSKQDYVTAEKLLNDAERYAKMTESDKLNLLLQKSSLYVILAEKDPKQNGGKLAQAAEMLEKGREKGYGQKDKNSISVTLAEVYNRMERFDDAITVLGEVLGKKQMETIFPVLQADEQPQYNAAEDDSDFALTDDDYAAIDRQLETDMQEMEAKIAEGIIDPDMEPVDFGVTEDGMEIPYFEDGAFGEPERSEPEEEPAGEDGSEEAGNMEAAVEKLENAFIDRILYVLLTALLGKNDFASARRCGAILKNGKTRAYAYYGRYAEAVSSLKLDGMTEETKMAYARAIAFFRSRTFADVKDTLAAVLRARLYAEEGEYEKAAELAELLAAQDKKVLFAYIAKCRARDQMPETGGTV